MDIFLSWDSDDLNRKVKRLSLSDDAAQIKQVYQAVDRANALWHSWVESIGGEIVSMDGDCGRATIPATRLSELPNIREQYSDAIGSPLSVGVATRLSQADRALLVAKRRGGDQVVLYTQEIERELEEKPSDESAAVVDDLAQSHLGKAEGPALLEGDKNAGMSGAKRPAAPVAPVHGAPEHSQGEAMRSMMEDENPGRPEMTHAARDFEEFFHREAEKQEQTDNEQREGAKESPNDGIKKQVAQVLEQVRSQAQTLEAIKSQAPQVYQAIMGMVKAVIAMARALPEDAQEKPQQDGEGEQVQKSEQPIVFEQPLRKSIKDIPMGKSIKPASLPAPMQMILKRSRAIAPNFKSFDYSHVLSAALQASGYRMFVFSNDPDKTNPDSAYSRTISAFIFHPNEKEDGGIVGGVSGRVDPFEHKGVVKPAINIGYASVHKNHRRRGLGQAAYEAVMAHAAHEFKVKLAAGDWHSSSASATHSRLADKHGFKYRPEPNFGPGTAYSNEKEWSEAKNQSFDNKFGAYAYTLKSERHVAPRIFIELDDELEKDGDSAGKRKRVVPLDEIHKKYKWFRIISPYGEIADTRSRGVVSFIPTVPKNVMTGEDMTTPRVCVGPDIYHCMAGVSGFPTHNEYDPDFDDDGFNEHLVGQPKSFSLFDLPKNIFQFHGWRVFAAPETPPGLDTDVADKVPDAEHTHEAWGTLRTPMKYIGRIVIPRDAKKDPEYSDDAWDFGVDDPGIKVRVSDSYLRDHSPSPQGKLFDKSESLAKGGEQQPNPELLRRIAEIVSTTKASAWSRVKAAGNVQEFNRFIEHWGNPQYEDEDIAGSQVVVAPNPHVGANAERQAEGDREYKPWRATYIDKDGAPTGHSEHDSYEEALNAAAYWGGADLFSKPLGAMRKDEEYRTDWYEPLNKAEKIIAKLGSKHELDPSEEPIGGNKLDKEEFDPEELKMGIEEEMEHTDNPKESEKIAKDHLKEDPKYYSKLKTAFAKGLPMPDPKKPTHHHLELPPGSQKDHSPQATREVGKVKVQHGDGKQGWVEVRAGQVLSADGHAISSRNKGGK